MFGLSLLQLFWGGQVVFAVVQLAKAVLAGAFLDKSCGDRDADAPLGWFQFRKRTATYQMVALLGSLWVLWNIIWACVWDAPSEHFTDTLAYLNGSKMGTTDPLHVLLALLLLTYHYGRRYRESISVSIFSGRQTLNPLVVMVTLANHFLMGVTATADLNLDFSQSCLSFGYLSLRPLVAIPLFLWATRIHRDAHAQLARLRMNRAGHVVTTAYKMPKGKWFDRVSSPHYFAEIIVYISVGVLLGSSACTWWLLTAYVFAVNMFLGYSTHLWYLTKFAEDYPKDRKVVITR